MNRSVSIIIPCYNAGEKIRETLNSLIRQSYTQWEAIVVDDCSTDQSVGIISSFVRDDPRIKLIKMEKNSGGPSAPRNLGIASAKGELIAFLDSDDIWMPEKLERQLTFMEKKNALLSCTSYELIDETGTPKNKVIHCLPIQNYKKFLRNTNIGFSSSVLYKNLLDGIQFRPFPVADDNQFWKDVFRKGYTMYGLDEVLVQYRVQKNSISSNKMKWAILIWKSYRRTEKFSFVESLFYFSCYAFNAIKKRI